MNYYNEIDPYAAAWLRNLIANGHLPQGDVDERDIRDVRPEDIRGYTQCHFFAGIGGWSYALRLAGWPDDKPVWSGSCPCQPFSAAGRGAGFTDERHLWPHFYYLIGQCRPPIVFGEQVTAAIGHGWFDLISTDLEGSGYAIGAADLCAASVGAPHIRQRLWWVADANYQRRRETGDTRRRGGVGGCGALADSMQSGRPERGTGAGDGQISGCGGNVGDPDRQGLAVGKRERSDDGSQQPAVERAGWGDLEWLPCLDGKARPTKPGLQPLATGVPGRVGQLRAAGNAIVPQVAAAFIRAYLDI